MLDCYQTWSEEPLMQAKDDHGGKKYGNWEAPSQEMMVFGGKFWNLVGNFVFLYIKTHYKLWEYWPASREINIFFQP